MFGRHSSLAALQARKRLLLLEAEIHRVQLRQDWAEMRGFFHYVREKTAPARSLLTVAGLIMAGISSIRWIRRAQQPKPPQSIVSQLLPTALAAILRFVLRPRARR